jgi:hypothetical protein
VPAKAWEKPAVPSAGESTVSYSAGTLEVQVVQWSKVDEEQVGSFVSFVKPICQANAIKCDQVFFFF